jgi:hypothetical protein
MLKYTLFCYAGYIYLDEQLSQPADVFPSNVPLLGHSSYVHACGYAKSLYYDLPSNNQMEMAQFPKLQIMKVTVKQQEVGQSRTFFKINLYNLC